MKNYGCSSLNNQYTSHTLYKLSKYIRFLCLICISILLIACDSGDSNNTSNSNESVEVSGYVIDGPISDSSVTLHRVNDDGTVGEQVAGPFTTDDHGQWSGSISNELTGTLVVVALGGQYTDDATGELVTLTADEPLYSWFDASSPEDHGVVSPITDSLWQVAQQEMSTGKTLGDAVVTAEQLATDFWGLDPTSDVPDASSNTDTNQRYGAMLGGYSYLMANRSEFQQEPFASMNRFTLTRLIMDDMADGRMDGIAIDGSQLATSDGTLFPALSVNDLSAFFTQVNIYTEILQIPPLAESYFRPYPALYNCPDDGFYIYGQGTEEQNLSGYNNIFPDTIGFGRNVVKVSIDDVQVTRTSYTDPQTGEEGYTDSYEVTFSDPGLNLTSNPGVWLAGHVLKFSSGGYLSTGSAISSTTPPGWGGPIALEDRQNNIYYSSAVDRNKAYITSGRALKFERGVEITIPDVNSPNQVHYAKICGYANVGSGGNPTFQPAGDDHDDLFFVGVQVEGLSGTVVLRNNDGDAKSISADDLHYFSNPIADSAFYNVSIATQPSGQTCSLASSAGQVNSANVSTVTLSCSDDPEPGFRIGGSVSGLNGSLVLQNNAGDNITLTSNGSFVFGTELQSGSSYAVTILSAPASQNCTVSNSSGTTGSADITTVSVSCSTIQTYSIGGSVSGLSGSLVLQNNTGDDLTLSSNGSFVFGTELQSGNSYGVTILSAPSSQICTVSNGSGPTGTADITTVSVSCSTIPTYSIGGSLSGLSGSLVLQNNAGDNLTLTNNGSFVFGTELQSGNSYGVTILSAPSSQICTVSNGSGPTGTADITTVSVSCMTAPTYAIGGSVSGLFGDLVLQNNLGDNLAVTVNGPFTFATALQSAASYSITVFSSPAGQECGISNGSGSIVDSAITNVQVSCIDIPTYGFYSNAENWNYYVLNNGADKLDADNTACTESDVGTQGCIHGGEIRSISVPSETSCSSYTAEDALGAFDWVCLDDGGQVRFVSTGLKENKRLWDLVEPLPGLQGWTYQSTQKYKQARWKQNSLAVSDGATSIYTSPSAAWWTNEVRQNQHLNIDSYQTGIISLEDDGVIYLFTEIVGDRTAASNGGLKGDRKISLLSDHSAITVNPAITLPSWGNGGTFITHSSNFNWIEGNFNTNGDKESVSTFASPSSTKFSTFRYFNVSNVGQFGMNAGAGNNRYEHITLSSVSGNNSWNGGTALSISSSYNTFDDVKVINTAATAVVLSGSFNLLSTMMIANNASALAIQGNSNTVQNTVIASNDRDGILLTGEDNTLLNITTANNAQSGLSLNTADNNLLINVASVDNNWHGINAESSASLSLLNIASANNGDFTVQVTPGDGSGVSFGDSSAIVSGLVKVGNNSSDASADCTISNSTGLAADCSAADSSDSTLTTGMSLIASFVGSIGIDDVMNGSDSSGTLSYTGSTIDWTNFDNDFRTWGASGNAQQDILTSLLNRGRFGCSNDNQFSWLITSQSTCDSLSQYWHENGVIRDYSLTLSDTLLTDLPLYLNGNSASTMVHTWLDSSTTTFLRNALEITGNGNGLCESSETCLYTPNIGAYQGFGNIISAGSFVDGDTLTGITVLRHESSYSANADLGNLQLSAGSLTPEFDSAQLSYDVTVGSSTSSISLTPTVDDATATVTVDGTAVASGEVSSSFALSEGSSIDIPVVVTAENGSTNTYTISVYRSLPLSSDADLSRLTISAGSLSPAFDADVSNYTASVNFITSTFTIDPGASDSGASITVNDVLHDAADVLTLEEGQNIFVIEVTAEDSTVKSYTLAVTRQLAASYAEQAYIKASNAEAGDEFAYHGISISADTLVVGAAEEDSNATLINGDQGNASLPRNYGAVYAFTRDENTWSQSAYIKMPYIDYNARFGYSVSLSGDMLAVGAYAENSNAPGIGDTIINASAQGSGAVFIYTRDINGDWSYQTRIKASNSEAGDAFGTTVSLSGTTLAVGASGESSNTTGINTSETDNSLSSAGAAYVFTFDGADWSQQAYIKASNTDLYDRFGHSLVLNENTLAISAPGEQSNATGINGNQSDNSVELAGAVYVFTRSGTDWTQQAYIKASNPGEEDEFGFSLALSADTLAVGAPYEASNSSTINAGQTDDSFWGAGAVYIFTRSGTDWTQQAYIKASNANQNDYFGYSVALSGDLLAVGATGEQSIATGVNGDQGNTNTPNEWGPGAAYLYTRNIDTWSQTSYFKASNATINEQDNFGSSVAIDSSTIAVGAGQESNADSGINIDRTDNSAWGSGAAYIFQPLP